MSIYCSVFVIRLKAIFTVRRYACAVCAVIVCLSICLSQVGALHRWLNLGSHKQRHTIAQEL